MKQEATINRDSIVLDFSTKFCNSHEALLESDGFRRILSAYLTKLETRDTPVYEYLLKAVGSKEEIPDRVTKLFKLLIILDLEEVHILDQKYSILLKDKSIFIEFLEGLYNFWRKFERYAIISNSTRGEGLQNVNFIEALNNFKNLVITTYRLIEEALMGYKNRVYRQLNAGVNAGVILNGTKRSCPAEYAILEKIPFIDTVILQPPFITYPKRNTRKGIFQEVFENPIKDMVINRDNWFCYPAKVGESLVFIYFNRYFMSQGLSLCNLFELAKEEEYVNKAPDIIYVYGVKDYETEMKTVFYRDKENNRMVGYANYCEDIDYFGYMKKMILTLHNIRMIEQGHLPIHGAMVNITMKSGAVHNIVIMGDSGAGKSESLEAFRSLSEEYVKDMKTIFDDMGTLKLAEKAPLAYGTEIGAFVRLDDLDTGYAYKEIDRSIFMNPDKINSRIIIPISSYEEIMRGYPIDMFLYANNYEADGELIEFFTKKEEAIPVFKAGRRKAKGTTSETGIVDSYFANPFGPVQTQEKTDILIENFFEDMFKKGVKVGQIRTKLGIAGEEHSGPKAAATVLFEMLKPLK